MPLDRAAWDDAVAAFRDYSYRQSWAYGERLAARRGAVSEHVAVRRGDETIGLADVRIKRLPVVGGGLAFISGGPLVRRESVVDGGLEVLPVVLDALTEEFVHRRGLTLRILAPIGIEEHNRAVAACLANAGFRPAAHLSPYRTVILDLGRPLDEIRAGLRRPWRRDLNSSERQGLEMHVGTDLSDFDEIARMLDELRGRKEFDLDLDVAFYADVQSRLRERDRLVVGVVRRDGVPVAGNITAVHGDTAVYLIGASTEAGLATKAGYFMQWRTIEFLHARGVAWYDLGGIDPDGNPGGSFFKTRTNGLDVTAAGPLERAPSGPGARLTAWAEQGHARLRRALPG